MGLDTPTPHDSPASGKGIRLRNLSWLWTTDGTGPPQSTRFPQRAQWETGSFAVRHSGPVTLPPGGAESASGRGDATGPRCGALRLVVGWESTIVIVAQDVKMAVPIVPFPSMDGLSCAIGCSGDR